MRTNDAALQLIMKWETLQLRAYLCPSGVPTIGYGHTGDVTLDDVRIKRTITEHQADIILQHDLERTEAAVTGATRGLNENQFGALVAFAFNVGHTAFLRSTLLRFVNKGQLTSARGQFDRWVYGTDPKTKEKIKLRGLELRRAEEKALFSRVVHVA